MAKFSIFADDDEEDDYVGVGGPSCPTRKRPRLGPSHSSPTPSPSSGESDAAEPRPEGDGEQDYDVDNYYDEEEDDFDPIPNNDPGSDLSPWRPGSLRSPIDTDYARADHDDDEPQPRLAATDGGDRSVSVCLSDPDVLDCCVCFEPLTVPVFQCENGHTACSSCCTKLGNKCPTCSWPIGYNRCRAIEKVLESVKISCQNKQYGCNEIVSYSKKKDHDNTCTYSPCSCPFINCNFTSSSEQLYLHFSSLHSDSAVHFCYNSRFTVTMNACEKFLILLEQNDNISFILCRSVERLGSVVWVSCISPHSSHNWFDYDISAKNELDTLTLQSATTCTQGQVDSPLPIGFLLVPSDFPATRSELKLHLEIFKDSPTPACSERSINAA